VLPRQGSYSPSISNFKLAIFTSTQESDVSIPTKEPMKCRMALPPQLEDRTPQANKATQLSPRNFPRPRRRQRSVRCEAVRHGSWAGHSRVCWRLGKSVCTIAGWPKFHLQISVRESVTPNSIGTADSIMCQPSSYFRELRSRLWVASDSTMSQMLGIILRVVPTTMSWVAHCTSEYIPI